LVPDHRILPAGQEQRWPLEEFWQGIDVKGEAIVSSNQATA
jgi:hypothetical protein